MRALGLNSVPSSPTLRQRPDTIFGALSCGYTPVDLDTFAVYLGSLGYCLKLALRPGVQHSAAESEYNFERALPMASSLVLGSLLVRADSGFAL